MLINSQKVNNDVYDDLDDVDVDTDVIAEGVRLLKVAGVGLGLFGCNDERKLLNDI